MTGPGPVAAPLSRPAGSAGVVGSLPGVDERCDGCGFRFDDVPLAELPDRLRRLASRYTSRLTRLADRDRSEDLLRSPAGPGGRSVLDLAEEVLAILRRTRIRLAGTLAGELSDHVLGDGPVDPGAVADGAGPAELAQALARACDDLAHAVEHLGPEDWTRTILLRGEDPQERTLAWVGRESLHQGEHRLEDIDLVLRTVNPPGPG